MPKVLVNDENLTNIANAIREKNGETTTYKPGEMAEAIQNISSGGGDSELEASFISSIDGSLGANVTKLPSGITLIGYYAFAYRENLALTELPSNITKIEDSAFRNCTNLALTRLPSSLTSIGSYAFNYCSNLALTELPSNITKIGNSGFSNCTNLALTRLPSSLTSIGSDCFVNCANLALTELPSGIKTISYSLFSKCAKLSQISCKGDITKIDSYAFNYCSNLSTFVLPNVTQVPTGTSSMFNNTPIASGTGYIYVPDTLVDSFKSATNWSTYADQIKPISELEANA